MNMVATRAFVPGASREIGLVSASALVRGGTNVVLMGDLRSQTF